MFRNIVGNVSETRCKFHLGSQPQLKLAEVMKSAPKASHDYQKGKMLNVLRRITTLYKERTHVFSRKLLKYTKIYESINFEVKRINLTYCHSRSKLQQLSHKSPEFQP